MKFLSKYDRFISLVFFSILFTSIGIILFLPYSIFSFRDVPPWSISPERWDILLLRNYPAYLVEGKGGLGMVLGEPTYKLYQKWGSPEQRDYGKPEFLFYRGENFSGGFLVKRGRIIQIRYFVDRENKPFIKWITALGLKQETMENRKADKISEEILSFYGNVVHTKLPGEIIIQNRGIHFLFNKKGIREIRIFRPTWG